MSITFIRSVVQMLVYTFLMLKEVTIHLSGVGLLSSRGLLHGVFMVKITECGRIG